MKEVLVFFPYKYRQGVHPWSKNQIEALREAGMRVEVMSLPKDKKRKIYFFRLIFRFFSLFFKIPQKEVVYISANYFLSFVTFIAKFFKKKVIISHILSTAKESERLAVPSFLKFFLDILDKKAYKLADLIITDSVSTNKGIIKEFGVEKDKIIAIYSCLDLELFTPKEKYQKFASNLKKKLGIQKKDVLFYHGFFHVWHGLSYFLKAVPYLLKANPNFVFVILGTDKKNAHRFFPRKIITNPHFYFLPFVSYKKLPYYIALADLWFGRFAKEKGSILPAFSTAGIEAMACGKSIIVSSSSEYKQFIQDGVNSIMVPFNNSQAIFKKISFYFENQRNKKKLKKMGENARITAEKYFSRKELVKFFQQWFEDEKNEGKMMKSIWGRRIQGMDNYSKGGLKDKRVDKRLSSFIKGGEKILDVGCFYPTEAIRFAKKGSQVVSIDISPQVVEKAKEIVRKRGFTDKIKVEIGDATNLKFKDGSFDVVCDFTTSVLISRWQEALSEYARVLKKDGKLVIVTNNKLQPIAWIELFKQWLNRGVHPRWGYFAPLFPWQLKKELEGNSLIIKNFDSESMWKPILPRVYDLFLDNVLYSFSKKMKFVKYLGWRYGFVAIKK